MKVGPRTLAVGVIVATGFLLAPRATVAPPSDTDFMPPDLQYAAVVACYIGGNANGTADAKLYVKYGPDRHADWHMLYAQRPAAVSAIEDCRKWYQEVIKEMYRVAKEGKK